jgi:hypothetical protein
MIPTFRRAALALTAVAVSLSAGCADVRDTAVVPTAPDVGPAFNSQAEVAKLARFQVRPQITIAWARKWIGPEGGRLDFQGFAIEVPAGAVSRTTQFSIRLPVSPDGVEHVVAEFGPHNTHFAKPLTIEFPYRGTSIEGSSSAHVVWWNNGWVDMGGTVTADGARLSTTTDHFSTYGTTDEGRGPGVSTSGG